VLSWQPNFDHKFCKVGEVYVTDQALAQFKAVSQNYTAPTKYKNNKEIQWEAH
jgi:hypothetical protein